MQKDIFSIHKLAFTTPLVISHLAHLSFQTTDFCLILKMIVSLRFSHHSHKLWPTRKSQQDNSDLTIRRILVINYDSCQNQRFVDHWIFKHYLFQHNLNLYSSYRVSLIDANVVIIAVIDDFTVDVILVKCHHWWRHRNAIINHQE